jgi:hypothetical protein
MCNLRLRELQRHREDLESAFIEPVVFFHSPDWRLKRHVPEDGRDRVVPDPLWRAYGAYAVERSWTGLLVSMLLPSFYWRFAQAMVHGFWGGAVDNAIHFMPADFLIAPDGRVQVSHYGKHIGDHLALPEVLAAVRTAAAYAP